MRRRCSACARLAVYDALGPRRRQGARGIQEIPLAQIAGTLEPTRAAQFDHEFRPLAVSRARWQRLWLAQHNGAPLPPISVAPVRGGYAIRDGHHRVSVAAARGATTIDAFVDL